MVVSRSSFLPHFRHYALMVYKTNFLLNVGPDDTRFSYNQGDFGSRIKQNSVHEVVDLVPLFI